ncbi:MAG: hypothetical protein JNJ46_09360 [Myxococcales bacterium]|nr:hypothetical protein [Myxococcales bacterium]
MSFRARTCGTATRGDWVRGRAWAALLGLGLFAGGSACRDRAAQPSAQPVPSRAMDAGPRFAAEEAVVLLHSAHDTLGAARLALEEALRLPVDLPLPFPRVEKHGDQFRVVLARGPFAMLQPLAQALAASHKPAQLLAAGQAGGDDIIRLAIVCSPSDSVPLFSMPPAGAQSPGKEIARLRHGQVLALKEEDEGPAGGHDDEGGEEDERRPATLGERGYLSVLQPQLGLVHAPDVLLPADCTPRDEDNDDGNGRILAGTSVGAPKPGQVGRLCLTTRFAGKKGRQAQADLLAVSPNYRRCLRFLGAGTFDGFDHAGDGSHFAVEINEAQARSLPMAAASAGAHAGAATPSNPAGGPALRVHAVQEATAGQNGVVVRGQWPGLSRPAFLGDDLIAVSEEPASVALWSIDGLGKRAAGDASVLPAPRRIHQVALPGLPPLGEKLLASVHRPAAPTLSGERVKASFLRSCPPELAKRVKAQAGRGYVACLFELELEVGVHGSNPAADRRCHIDNADNPLEEPIRVPCPQ